MATDPWYKKWELWLAVLTVIAAFWQGWEAHEARMDAQAATQRADAEQQRADQEKAEAEKLRTQLAEEQNALSDFADLYRTLLSNVHIAASKYKEQKTPENEQALIAAAQAFVDFVEKWRELQKKLAVMLDGEVTDLAARIRNHDLDGISLDVDTIQRGAETNLPVLKELLRQSYQKPLENPAPPAAPTGLKAITQ
jgi:hypothetical protein